MLGSIGAALVGAIPGLVQAGAARRAASAQEDAAQGQLDLQREMYDTTRADIAPWLQAGGNALQAYMGELGFGEDGSYSGMQESPAFRFMLNRGMEDVQSSAAARGGLWSGATGEAMEQFRSGMASQEANNWLSRLANLGATGQNAAAMTGAAAQNFAAQGSGALANMGNAQASGIMGAANGLQAAIGGGLGMYGYSAPPWQQQQAGGGQRPPSAGLQSLMQRGMQ